MCLQKNITVLSFSPCVYNNMRIYNFFSNIERISCLISMASKYLILHQSATQERLPIETQYKLCAVLIGQQNYVASKMQCFDRRPFLCCFLLGHHSKRCYFRQALN